MTTHVATRLRTTAEGRCRLHLHTYVELKGHQAAYVSACDALDALVWGAPLGGAASQKPVGRAKNRLVVLIDEQERERAAEQARRAGDRAPPPLAWVERALAPPEGVLFTEKRAFSDRDRALIEALDPELVAAKQKAKRQALREARAKAEAEAEVDSDDLERAPLPLAPERSASAGPPPPDEDGRIETDCGLMAPAPGDLPAPPRGVRVHSLRWLDYAPFFHCLTTDVHCSDVRQQLALKRTAFSKAFRPQLAAAAAARGGRLPASTEAVLEREYERLRKAHAIDRRRREAVFVALGSERRRDDTYETHYVRAYLRPAWELAKHARAPAAEQAGWTENEARAIRDVSTKRAAELGAVPLGKERPPSPVASNKRKRDELVGPNGETLETHDFSIEKESCGGRGQKIDVPTWSKKQRAE